MMKRLSRTAATLAFLASVLASGTAFAQDEEARKKKALELYDQGTAQYNLGRWDKAILLFEQAYEAYPAPAFLYNIGQAHRQQGNCKDAVFFYKRYLALKSDAPNRAEAEGFIKDQEEVCKKRDEASGRPPTNTESPGETGTNTAATGGTSPAGDTTTGTTGTTDSPGDGATTGGGTQVADAGGTTSGGGVKTTVGTGSGSGGSLTEEADIAAPELLVANLGLGASFLSMGDELDSPVRFALALGVGYPIRVGPAILDVGAMVTFTPLPYDEDDDGESDGTAKLTGLLANVGVTYPVMPKLAIRAELGLGTQIFGGIDGEEHFFIEDDMMATGGLAMFNARVALGARYSLSDSLVAFAQPVVFSYSPPKEGLREDITALSAFQLLAGVGFQM